MSPRPGPLRGGPGGITPPASGSPAPPTPKTDRQGQGTADRQRWTRGLLRPQDPGSRRWCRRTRGEGTPAPPYGFGDGSLYARVERGLPVLHGINGEDGTVRIPQAGQRALCRQWCLRLRGVYGQAVHQRRPPRRYPRRRRDRAHRTARTHRREKARLGLPVFVSPPGVVLDWRVQGQRLGRPARRGDRAFRHDGKILVEAMLHGVEVECGGVLQYPDGAVRASYPSMLKGTERTGRRASTASTPSTSTTSSATRSPPRCPRPRSPRCVVSPSRPSPPWTAPVWPRGLLRHRGRSGAQRAEHHARVHPDQHVPKMFEATGVATRSCSTSSSRRRCADGGGAAAAQGRAAA